MWGVGISAHCTLCIENMCIFFTICINNIKNVELQKHCRTCDRDALPIKAVCTVIKAYPDLIDLSDPHERIKISIRF